MYRSPSSGARNAWTSPLSELPEADGFDRSKATEDIRRIIMTYPEAVDRGNIEGIVDLLAGVRMCNSLGINAPEVPEADIPLLSAEDVRRIYTGVIIYEDGLPHTKHLITNIDVWFSDDRQTAFSQCCYTVIQGMHDFPLQVIIAGRYEDTFTRATGQWRLAIRREYADLVGDLARHVKPQVVERLQGHGN